MRLAMEIIGIVLLISGVGGLINDEFGLLAGLADGAALTALQVAAAVVGAALIGLSLMGRKNAKPDRKKSNEAEDLIDEALEDLI